MVRGALIGLAVPVLAAAVLGVEVVVARQGPTVAPPPPDVPTRFSDGQLAQALWLGDSTAAGVGVDEREEVLAYQVADRLGAGPIGIVDLAVSGHRVSDVVEQQLPRITGQAVRVYVSVGANDAVHLTTAGAFARTYRLLIRRLRELLGDDTEIVLLGVPDMGAPTRLPQPLRALAGWRGRRLDRAIVDLAAGDARITHVPIAAATGPAFRRDPDRYFAADSYHPSAAGYALWADVIADAVAEAG